MSDVVGSAQVIIEPEGLAEFEREIQRGVTAALKTVERQLGAVDKQLRDATDSAKKLSKKLSTVGGDVDIKVDASSVTKSIDAAVEAADNDITVEAQTGGITGAIDSAIDAADTQLSLDFETEGDLGAGRQLDLFTGEVSETMAGVAGEVTETMAGVGGEITETMAGVSGEIAETFAGVSGEAAEALAGVAGEAAETGAAVSGEFAEAGVGAAAAGSAVGGFGRALKFIGPLVAGVGLAAFFKKSSDEASILQESTTKVEAVFGELSPALKEFASTSAESFAIAESAALGAVGTFGNLFTALGVSTETAAQLSPNLVALSADLASFNDLAGGSEEALVSLRAAVTGEFEPLRRLGVALTDVAVRNRAVDLGLADTAVTATSQARILARYDLIMEQTANQQNDFARTSQFLANQQRLLSAEFKTLQADVGQALQPVFLSLIDIIRELLPSFEIMASTVAELAGVFLTSLEPVLSALAPAFEAFSASLEMLVVQLGPVLVNIGEALGAVLAELVTGFGELLVSLGPALVNLGALSVLMLTATAPALEAIAALLVLIPTPLLEIAAIGFTVSKVFGAFNTAAVGLTSSLKKLKAGAVNAGPVVLGLAAAVTIGVFAYEAAGRAARELDEDVKELTASLLEATETAETTFQAVEKFVGVKFGEDLGDEALEQINALGIGIDDIVQSIEAGGDAIEPFRETLRGLGVDIAESAPKDEIIRQLDGFQNGLAEVERLIDRNSLENAAAQFEAMGVSIPEGAGVAELTAKLDELSGVADISIGQLEDSLDSIEDYDDGAQRAAKAVLEQLQFEGRLTEERKESAIAAQDLGEGQFNYAAALQEVDAELLKVAESTAEAGAETFDYNRDTETMIAEMQAADRAARTLTESLSEIAKATLESADAQEAMNRRIAEQKGVIDGQISSIQRQKEALQDSADAQRDAIDAQVESVERQKEAAQKAGNARKDAIAKQIDALKGQKKALEEAAKVEKKARKEQADAIKKLNDAREDEIKELQRLEDEARSAFSGFVSAADKLSGVLSDLPDNAEASLSAFREVVSTNLQDTADFVFGIKELFRRGADDLARFLLAQGEGASAAVTEARALTSGALAEQERFFEQTKVQNEGNLGELEGLLDEIDGIDVPEFEPIEAPEIEVDISEAVDAFDAQIESLQEAADSIDIDLSAAVDNFDAQIDRLRESAERIDISANIDNFDAQIDRLRESSERLGEDAVPTFEDFQAAIATQLADQERFGAALAILYERDAFATAEFFAGEGLSALAAAENAAALDESELARREGVFGEQLAALSAQADGAAIFGLQASLAGELYGRGLNETFLEGWDPSVIAGVYAQLEADTITEADAVTLLMKNKLETLAEQTGLSAQEIADLWGIKFDLSDPVFEELENVEAAIFGKKDDTGDASGEHGGVGAERFANEFQWALPVEEEIGRTKRQIELDQSIGSASYEAGGGGRDQFGRGLRLDIETSQAINAARKSYLPVINGTAKINDDAYDAGESIGGDTIGGIVSALDGAATPGSPVDQSTRGLVNFIEGVARDEGEANSPSKLFARFGDDIAAGTAKGIKDGIAGRTPGLFDALTDEFQSLDTLSTDFNANVGGSFSIADGTLPDLVAVGGGAAASGGAQSVTIEQNVTVQAPVGMTTTEAERIGGVIAQQARQNVIAAVRTSGRTGRSN